MNGDPHAKPVARVYNGRMSPTLAIVLAISLVGLTLYIGKQIRDVRLQRRNLQHYEKNEPLEGGVDKWD